MFGSVGFRSTTILWVWCSVLSMVVSQDPTMAPTAVGWGGCVDPNDPAALVTIGEKTTICLVIADGADWSTSRTYMRLNFQPSADEYSRFHVPNSFKELVMDGDSTNVGRIYAGKNITVHASSQKAISYQKRYFDSFSKVYPHLTAIIDVQDGVVLGIAWDDASLFCTKSETERNTFDYAGNAGSSGQFGQPVDGCFITEDECTASYNNGETACDLVLYVVWTGTDSKGNSLQSSAYRFSAFPAQELGDRFSQNLPDFPSIDVDLNPLN